MDNAVHVAACPFDRPLQSVHRSRDVLFEGVGHQNMVVLGKTVVGACAGEIVDAIVRMAACRAARRVSSRTALRGATRTGCRGGRLLGEELRSTARKSSQRRDSAKEVAPGVKCHRTSPFSRSLIISGQQPYL